jgi:hypothetical protein
MEQRQLMQHFSDYCVCARSQNRSSSDEQVAGHILKALGRDFIGMHSALTWKGARSC